MAEGAGVDFTIPKGATQVTNAEPIDPTDQATNAAGQVVSDKAGEVPPREADEQLQLAAYDAAVIAEAKDRFARCEKWEAVARVRWVNDFKFAEGDSDNQYQWPNEIRRERDIDERPCLTINKTRQHCLQIVNDAKQNKPAIKVRATGGGSTVDSARVYNAIMRHIEYVSHAQVAYDTATSYQVKCGKGYLRLVTDWEDAESFNQVPYIRRVLDPMTIYLDPDAREADKSDARFGFIFEDMDNDEFDKLYPQYKSIAAGQALDEGWTWKLENKIKFAEYFRIVEKDDTLWAIPRPRAQGASAMPPPPAIFRESDLARDPGLLRKVQNMRGVRSRPTVRREVEWFLLVGTKIAERSIWPGKYIPIIPVVGEETIIDGQYDCKGHTRALRDPQRMYNYMSSIAVEYSSLQSKTPWIAPAEAIEGLEAYWTDANRINYSVLPYNAVRDDGQDIPKPERIQPPVAMPAALQGMQIAMQEMMMASGQYEANFGQQGNERSAKAINERERQGDTSTYHFIDNLAIAIRCVGRQLLDLIPKLYDTERVMSILAEDGTPMDVRIDPSAAQAILMQQQEDAHATVNVLFNPNVGKYDVQADVGPSWGTKRDESANALTLILTQAPQLAPIVADLLIQCLDFDLAEEAAERLRRMVPPQALGTGPSQSEQQLQLQVQQLGNLLKQTMQELSIEKLKGRGKDQLRDIEAYKAGSSRLVDLIHAATEQGVKIDSAKLKELIADASDDASDASLESVVAASAPTLRGAALVGGAAQAPGAATGEAEGPPVPGARKAKDGEWYVRDREGAFAKVKRAGAK